MNRYLYSQAQQDVFILNILKGKQNGYFIELGSNDPIVINNTFLLETHFNWKGIMIEYNETYLDKYKEIRPNSVHIINDATLIDYNDLFLKNDVPQNIDYLQVDLEPGNGSTLKLIELFDNSGIFDKYKFAVVTFEHDIYQASNPEFTDAEKQVYIDTKNKSIEIFKKYGYVMVFENINDKRDLSVAFEDWYVHPDLVDMNYINQLKNKNKYHGTIWCANINY